MANWFQSLKRALGFGRKPGPPAEAMSEVNPELLQKMVKAAVNTREDELDCDECFEQLDAFVELRLRGKDAAAAMPLVEDHLRRCGDCREEFEALLKALQSTT